MGLIIVFGAGMPDSPEEWQRTLELTPVLCLGMGLFFAVLFGLVDLTSPAVHIKEKYVVRQHGQSVETWHYAHIEHYELEQVEIGEQTVLVLTLWMQDGGVVDIEVARDISECELHRAFDGKLSRLPAAA